MLAVRLLGCTLSGLGAGPDAGVETLCAACTSAKGSQGTPRRRRSRKGPEGGAAAAAAPAAPAARAASAGHEGLRPDACDACLRRAAACELSQQLGEPLGSLSDVWAERYMLLIARDEGTPDDAAAGSAYSAASPLHASQAFLGGCFQLCEWAALLWTDEDGDAGDGVRQDRRLLAKMWEHFRVGTSEHGVGQAGVVGEPALGLLRPRRLELSSLAAAVRARVTRAALLQLRSPRSCLRAGALRTLTVTTSRVGRGPAQELVPRPLLLALLTRDPSAHVRQAALILVGRMSDGGGAQEARHTAEADPSWALRALKASAVGDPSAAVCAAACRALGSFVRHHPEHAAALEVCGVLVAVVSGAPAGSPGTSAALIEDLG